MASQVIVLIAAKRCINQLYCCHLPLATCISLAPLAAQAFAFTRRVFLSMQPMASNCDGLATAAACAAFCCNRLQPTPATTSRGGNVATSACSSSSSSYFRLPHFVAATVAATTPKRASHLAYATHTPRQVTQILWHEQQQQQQQHAKQRRVG